MTQTTKAAFALFLLLAFAATGCYSKVRPTGYFTDEQYANFNLVDRRSVKLHIDDEAVKRAALERPAINVAAFEAPPDVFPVLFVVENPQWLAPRRLAEEEAMENVLFTIRERTYRYLLRAYDHPVRVRYAYRRGDEILKGYRVISVRMSVTDVKRGNGFLRYVLGYGVGQSRIQVEGEFLEGITDPIPIGRFAYRTAHGGYSQSGWNPMVVSNEYVLKYAVEEGVTNFIEALVEHLPGIQTIDGKAAPVPAQLAEQPADDRSLPVK